MTCWSYSSLVVHELASLTLAAIVGVQLRLMVPTMDLQRPSRVGIWLGLWQLVPVCPGMPHLQHSPNVTGAVPGVRGYGRVSLTYAPGLSKFHWAICALYDVWPAGMFGWMGSASHMTSAMHSLGFCSVCMLVGFVVGRNLALETG
jgi:hypothetical protein